MQPKYFLIGCSFLSILGGSAVLAQDSTGGICPAVVDRTVQTIANRHQLNRFHWGLYVQPLNSPIPVANFQGQSLFVPASTNKLLTTAAALRQFGSQYRLRTSLYQDPQSNPQQPSLILVGRGDPTLTVNHIQNLSNQLKTKGFQQIDRLTIDAGYFRGPTTNPDWEWGDLLEDYGVPITNLILQQNAVSLQLRPQRVGQPVAYSWPNPLAALPWQIDNRSSTSPAGSESTIMVQGLIGKPQLLLTGQIPVNSSTKTLSLAMLDPINTWRSQLQFQINQQQITVNRTQVVTNEVTALGPEVAALESPPLGSLITEINRNSNNLYAEVLLRTLGRAHPEHNSSSSSTADLGLTMVEKKLTELGVTATNYHQADGSGLSRKNLVAPITLVQTLVAMDKTPEGSLYRDSLAVSGVNGTLSNRFLGNKRLVQGKTGTLTGVVALAGYLNPPNYQPLAFSVVVNSHDQPSSKIRAAIDELVSVFGRLRSCP